jgi:hypothetical protein
MKKEVRFGEAWEKQEYWKGDRMARQGRKVRVIRSFLRSCACRAALGTQWTAWGLARTRKRVLRKRGKQQD